MKKNIIKVIGVVVILGLGIFVGCNFMNTPQEVNIKETIVTESIEGKNSGFLMAVVDDQKIMQEGKVYVDLKEEQESRLAKIKKEAEAEKEKLKKENDRIAKLRSSVSQEEFNKEVEKFAAWQKKSSEELGAKLKALDTAYINAVNKVKEEGVDIILAEIAKEQGLSFITSKMLALYYVPALDVTETVIFRLNKRIPKASLDM